MDKLFTDFNSIEFAKDLDKRKLTVAAYNEIAAILQEIAKYHRTTVTTISDRVANYFKKFGHKVECENGIYILTCKTVEGRGL
ncbi:MAG: hypothetical protein Q4E64_03820 [Phascolarctobacterium sp.]|uniref:hypothetical protein n=1 Tax=Phascolarctobacterium sp. TaxID=2049039 RepID=UPI0026DD4948|nr:hypothetical protein [Phascolarctobacterium sp.]MDO4920941.1 hypothetical protein [Phascolarctobacterium sp.]